MGVSAVFVSALARTRLPAPANPPENQAQLLAAVIQPIVSFVVLGSVVVREFFSGLSIGNRSDMGTFTTDGLSIPSFNLGRGVRLSLSFTWTRTRTGPSIPDWVLYARRTESNTSTPTADADVERGVETSRMTDTVLEVGPDQMNNDSPSPSPAEAATPDYAVEEVVIIIGNHGFSGGSVEATAPTKVCFPLFLNQLMVR